MRRKIGPKSYFISLIGVVLITNIAILLDMPVFRQVLGFLCFTIIPGLLIFHILRLRDIGFVKGLPISVGLSISFLMFGGLLINAVLPAVGYSTPLSTISLVISFSAILAVLCLMAYWRNRDSFQPPSIPRLRMSASKSLLSLLLFPILFPLLSVLGTHLMNTEGNNVILMAMLFLIPAYVIALVCLNRRIHPATYPLAIGMIGMALLLMHGLTGNYIAGGDIHAEWPSFITTASHLHWSMAKMPSYVGSCLSISLLPTIHQSLLGIDELSVFKIVFPIVVSTVPVACYILFKKYVSPIYAFISSFLLIVQGAFIGISSGQVRLGVALLFLVLALLVYFSDEIGKLSKRSILLLFIPSVVVSYYLLAYVLFILLISGYMFSKFSARRGTITGSTVALCLVFIFLWQSQLTQQPFALSISFARSFFLSIENIFNIELANPSVRAIYSLSGTSIPETISIVLQVVIFALISIGLLTLLIRYIRHKDRQFEPEYIAMMVASWIMVLALFLTPTGLAFGRVHFLVLTLIACAFVIGVELICKYIRISRLTLLLVTLIVLLQFLGATRLLYKPFGLSGPKYTSLTGMDHDIGYIHEQEVQAARWFNLYQAEETLPIHIDVLGGNIFMFAAREANVRIAPLNENLLVSGSPNGDSYIFLRYANIINGKVYDQFQPFAFGVSPGTDIEKYRPLLMKKHKIYANGGAEIYK